MIKSIFFPEVEGHKNEKAFFPLKTDRVIYHLYTMKCGFCFDF